MSQFSLFKVPSWEDRQAEFLRITVLALVHLRQNPPDSPSETLLNRALYLSLIETVLDQKFDWSPTPEGKSPPDISDRERTAREDKICDFYWSFVDHARGSMRYLYIECKRLGSPSSPSWILNTNYVQNGIRRFITSPHEYGKNETLCGMVGYVQDMELPAILEEVNQAASTATESIPPLILDNSGWQIQGVSTLTHDLSRPFPASPFELKHYWVDLRN